MRKNNGFVFMETLVVMSVLSITLMMLFASYSYILRKSRERATFDTTETIYKSYYIKQIIDEYVGEESYGTSFEVYANNNLKSSGGECSRITYGDDYSYTCDLSSDTYSGYLFQVKSAFEVEKIYYLNPSKLLASKYASRWLNNFDATTIDYIRELGESTESYVMIVKYKKTYNKTDGSFETLHSSIEVTS